MGTEFQSYRKKGACYSISTLGTKALLRNYSRAAENYTEKEKQTETEGVEKQREKGKGRESLSKEKLGYYKPTRTLVTSWVITSKLTKALLVIITIFATRKRRNLDELCHSLDSFQKLERYIEAVVPK